MKLKAAEVGAPSTKYVAGGQRSRDSGAAATAAGELSGLSAQARRG